MVSVKDNSILKKICAVIVMITALVFFSFNVFADTPVQPLQVITYSDTTTNVRISGTAERLHYNVDSFQVVFMNPPNNYGTACTPILVSFRFYNSSDLPAYVGQAEFELTATNGTGAVNTIIYGYDQISTDLFVAESSYSTAEVGRIGIGASNDFAYYTGFVIPPHTSLYFSCIVYVNASAYGQNNTGATEDVNQVTLSSLNLYSNQISFSADYPYHNQPIDFSDIIDAISEMNESISDENNGALYTLIQSFMNDSVFTGTSYVYNAEAVQNNNYNGYFPSSDNRMATMQLRRFVGRPYLISVDVNDNSNTDVSNVNGARRYPFYIKISVNIANNSRLNYESVIANLFPNNTVVNIDYFYSEMYSGLFRDNNNIYLPLKHKIGNYSYLKYGWYSTYIVGHIDVQYNSNVTWNAVDLTSGITSISIDSNNTYAPNDEYTILRDLYLAYSQVNGLDDSSDLSNDVADVSDSNHIIEESYYSANASAIEATGLSNYRFSNEQNNGIGQVADDFMLLWNALGSWNGVYIFSLTMALATFIMRHGGLFTIKRETSDKGGEGD